MPIKLVMFGHICLSPQPHFLDDMKLWTLFSNGSMDVGDMNIALKAWGVK
jgi:hypothetical protein